MDIARKGGILILSVVVIDLISWGVGLIHNLSDFLQVSGLAAAGAAGVLALFSSSEKIAIMIKKVIHTDQYVKKNTGQVIGTQINITPPTTAPTQTLSSPVRLQLPPHPDPFRGRVDELAELQAALQPGKIVTICASGGMGKTALSGEALWRMTEGETQPPAAFPDGVFFHTFYNQPSVEAAFEELARFFGEEAKPTPEAAARRALSGKCALLILDGAEDADRLEALIELHGRCGVLITTRDRAQIQGVEIELQTLGKRAALQLLKDSAGEYARPEARGEADLRAGRLPAAGAEPGRALYVRHQQKAAEYLGFLEKTPLAALHLDERRHQEHAGAVRAQPRSARGGGGGDPGAVRAARLRPAGRTLAERGLRGRSRAAEGAGRADPLRPAAALGDEQPACPRPAAHLRPRSYPRRRAALRALAGRWASYVEEQTALGGGGLRAPRPAPPAPARAPSSG